MKALSKTIKVFMDRMLSEEGENALHIANIIRRYSESGWSKKKMQRALSMLSPNLKEMANFFDMDPSETEKISRNTGIPICKITFVSMLLKPKLYFPMDENTVDISKKEGISTNSYASFLQGWRNFIKRNSQYADDFLDLYMVLFGNGKESVSDNSISKELVGQFKKIDIFSLTDKKVDYFRDIYRRLLPSDRRRVADSIVNPYVKGVLLRPRSEQLVVDGSNVAMVNLPYPDLDNIFIAFELIGKMKRVPWPFRMIFDANFIYKLRGSQKRIFEENFQKDFRVSFHSPADEKILEAARIASSCILTNDRYLDYPKVNAAMLRFDGKRVWEDRMQA